MTPFSFNRIQRLLAATACAGACSLLTSGCASTPAGISTASERQLVITMTVAGAINSSDYYYVAFNTSNDASGAAGPEPPVAANWGFNGIVTGTATQYVEYNGSILNGGYQFGDYRGTEGNLQEVAVGVPIDPTPIVSGTTQMISFRIPLADLATSSITASEITYVQINFINTNLRATDTLGQLPSPKLFDALGTSSSNTGDSDDWVTIPVGQDGYYSNETPGLNVEPSSQDVGSTEGGGDVTGTSDPDAPNLDIRDWSVEVTGTSGT